MDLSRRAAGSCRIIFKNAASRRSLQLRMSRVPVSSVFESKSD